MGGSRFALAAVGLALVAASPPVSASHDKTDVAKTENGSIYIGEIKSVEFATLNLNTSAAGQISIAWRHVTGLTSKFEYRIELTGDALYYGSLGQPSRSGRLNIVTPSGATEVDIESVVSIAPVEQGFWRALDGSVNFGLTYTQASDTFQYNFSAEALRRTRKQYSALSGQSIFNTQQDAEATSQHYLKFIITQFTKSDWGPSEVGQLQSNPDQGYDLRLLLGGGASNFLVESSTKLVALNLGVVYNREEVTDAPDVDESAEAMAGVAFRRFKRGSHSPSVQLSLMTFTTLDSTHRFRTVLNFYVGWKIIGDFNFSCQINNSYDSQPPTAEADKTDVTVVTSVGYTF
jgi:hypothetical protein